MEGQTACPKLWLDTHPSPSVNNSQTFSAQAGAPGPEEMSLMAAVCELGPGEGLSDEAVVGCTSMRNQVRIPRTW